MTEGEQRTLAGYKSKVHEAGEFENPNEGKTPLNDTDEYVFQLRTFPRVKEFSQLKEKKDGTRTTVKVDKAICEFVEESTKNIVLAFFRVDSLNFSEDEAFESAVVRFFKKIKAPLPENVEPEWDRHFVVNMRFRGRVVVGKDEKKLPTGKYFLDVPTCRPLLPGDKHPDAVASTQENAAKETSTATGSIGAVLANAKIIVHGCTSSVEAYQRLLDAKVTADVIAAFVDADKKGLITYPI